LPPKPCSNASTTMCYCVYPRSFSPGLFFPSLRCVIRTLLSLRRTKSPILLEQSCKLVYSVSIQYPSYWMNASSIPDGHFPRIAMRNEFTAAEWREAVLRWTKCRHNIALSQGSRIPRSFVFDDVFHHTPGSRWLFRFWNKSTDHPNAPEILCMDLQTKNSVPCDPVPPDVVFRNPSTYSLNPTQVLLVDARVHNPPLTPYFPPTNG
jgi:hypothetical protein